MTRTMPLALLMLFGLTSLAPAAYAKRIGISVPGIPVKDVIRALPDAGALAPSDVVDINEVYDHLFVPHFFDFRAPRPTSWPSELNADWDSGVAECAAFVGDDVTAIADLEARPCSLELAGALLQRYLEFQKLDEVVAVLFVEDPKTKALVAYAQRFAPNAATMNVGSARNADKLTLTIAAIRAASGPSAAPYDRSNRRAFPKGPPADSPELHAGVAILALAPVDLGETCARARITLDIEPASAPVAMTTRALYAKSLKTDGDASVPPVRCKVRLWHVKKNPLGSESRMQSYRATLACDDTPRIVGSGFGISSEQSLQSMAPTLVKKLAAARCPTP